MDSLKARKKNWKKMNQLLNSLSQPNNDTGSPSRIGTEDENDEDYLGNVKL